MPAQIEKILDQLMCQGEVAMYLSAKYEPVDESELSRMASRGDGPPHRKKWGRNLYAQADVDDWIRQQKEAAADN